MDIILKKNSDLIIDLPTDKNQPTHTELKVINSLFKEDCVKPRTFFQFITTIFQYVFLTFLIMLGYFVSNDTIKKFLPAIMNNNDMFVIFIKALLISFIYYLFNSYFYKK